MPWRRPAASATGIGRCAGRPAPRKPSRFATGASVFMDRTTRLRSWGDGISSSGATARFRRWWPSTTAARSPGRRRTRTTLASGGSAASRRCWRRRRRVGAGPCASGSAEALRRFRSRRNRYACAASTSRVDWRDGARAASRWRRSPIWTATHSAPPKMRFAPPRSCDSDRHRRRRRALATTRPRRWPAASIGRAPFRKPSARRSWLRLMRSSSNGPEGEERWISSSTPWRRPRGRSTRRHAMPPCSSKERRATSVSRASGAFSGRTPAAAIPLGRARATTATPPRRCWRWHATPSFRMPSVRSKSASSGRKPGGPRRKARSRRTPAAGSKRPGTGPQTRPLGRPPLRRAAFWTRATSRRRRRRTRT
mmetsp:Transcript_9899/g.30828  ORF Transcript_9899/g.30828 Transcript_9899/m.30828 type:complete len:367 (-) Transcript_9899:85-1185(-)